MVKFIAKNLAMVIFLGILLVGTIGIVSVAGAQETLPKGGDSFATAVKIEPGSYKGGAVESVEKEYFYINIKPGQQIKLKGTFIPAGYGANCVLYLYDENETRLDGEEYTAGPISAFWLPDSNRDLYKYYIKVGSTAGALSSYSLDVSLRDCYDAGSEKDAGDTFDKAIEIKGGKYTGYLAGPYKGTDEIDIYKIPVKKGETLIAKVTPPSNTVLSLGFYDDDRRLISEEIAPNRGAIVSNSVEITRDGEIFAKVVAEKGGENLNVYSLEVGTEGVAAVKELGAVKEDKAVREKPKIEDKSPFKEGLLPEEGLTEKEAQEAKKGLVRGGIIPAIIGLVVLIIIAIVIVFLVRKKKKIE